MLAKGRALPREQTGLQVRYNQHMVLPALPSSIPVLVTGASSGIGAEFARQFAERGHDCTLVARRKDRLESLAGQLAAAYGITATTLTADLATPEGVDAVKKHIATASAWIVVNNAGFGTSGPFSHAHIERDLEEIRLNVSALHALTHAALVQNLPHRSGGIINVASLAGFQPIPFMATYAATKAFVLHFTEAVAEENAGSGVRIMALCPGPVPTEFGTIAHAGPMFSQIPSLPVDQCVQLALRAFDRNRVICVPGNGPTVLSALSRLAPRAVIRKSLGRVLKAGISRG